MNKTEVISYLRQNCIAQDPKVLPNDPAFLSLTDLQLELVVKVALTKESPYDNVDSIPPEVIYPVILVAKKELYYQLASSTAPLFPISMGSDGGLQKNKRFDHYLSLIQEVEKEYKVYKDLGTPVVSGDVKLSSRYYSNRNYNMATPPSCILNADLVRSDSVDLSWTTRNVDRFYSYLLYESLETIVDQYNPNNPVNQSAEKVTEVFNIHDNMYRITGLSPNTTYHVALAVQERNGLKGFSEITFTTQL